jgi:hypothetical protein
MATNVTYTTRVMSDKGVIYDINISDIAPGSVTATGVRDGAGDRSFLGNDFKLSYKGEDDDIFDPIKSSSLKFPFVIQDATDEAVIENIFTVEFGRNWYVSVWRTPDIADPFVLYWWGYLSPLTAKRPNEYFPFDYDLEALDTLALIRDIKIWSRQYVNQTYLPSLGIYVPIPKYRFGADRQTVGGSNTIYPKQHTSVIEIIYSLLYDLDTDLTGNLNAVTYWTSGQTPTVNTGALNHVTLSAWWYLFEDMPPNTNGLNFPVIRKQDVTVGDILKEVCQLFCLRIFQKDGEYWVVQPEAYQTGGTLTNWKYKKGASSTSGNHPVTNGSSSLTTTNYLKTIALPPTDPQILEGSYWSKLKALWGTWILGGRSVSTMDYKVERSISGGTNNLSDLSTEEFGFEVIMPEDQIFYRDTAPSLLFQIWDRGSSGNYFNTYITTVNARIEVRNKFRWIFEGTIFTNEYNMLMGISYDGKTYIPHSITHEASTDHFKCKWLEMRIDTSDLKEPYGYYILDDL